MKRLELSSIVELTSSLSDSQRGGPDISEMIWRSYEIERDLQSCTRISRSSLCDMIEGSRLDMGRIALVVNHGR